MPKHAGSIAVGAGLAVTLTLALWLGLAGRRETARRALDGGAPSVHEDDLGRPPARTPAQPSSGDRGPARPSPGEQSAPNAAQALHDVQSLVDQGRVGAARDLAELYLKRIPDGPEAARIQSLTGVHPHP